MVKSRYTLKCGLIGGSVGEVNKALKVVVKRWFQFHVPVCVITFMIGPAVTYGRIEARLIDTDPQLFGSV